MQLKKLLLITLLSTATLFAVFGEVDCTKEAHYKNILHITQGDCQALEAFWTATGEGVGWKKHKNWAKLEHAGDWFGIYMNDDNASVRVLYLPDNNLTGNIPAKIGNFTSLKRIDLNYNNLTGNIPATINSLIQLTNLDLGDNDFSGSLPKLSQATQLKYLQLYSNDFTGSVPIEYAQLRSLTGIWIGSNKLSGAIPDLSQLSSLDKFSFANNRFTFSDIEPQIEWLKTVHDVKYQYQHFIDEKKHPVVYFDDVLNIEPSLAYNKNDLYTWKKDDDKLTVDAARIYRKTNATKADDEGFYLYYVKNSVVTRSYDGGNLILFGTAIQALHDNKPTLSNPTPKTTVNEGIEYTYTSNISDADGDELSVTVGTLPSWLTLTSDATSFRLNGTPDFEEAGNYDINITVTDGKIPVHINYTLTVQQNIPEGYTTGDNTYTHTATGTSIAIGSPYYYHFPKVDENDEIELQSGKTQWVNVYERLTPEGVLTTGYYMTKGSTAKTPTLSTPYPKGSKAILLEEEPKTQKHQPMIMVEIPLTKPVTIGE